MARPNVLNAALVCLVALNLFFLSASLASRLILVQEMVTLPDFVGTPVESARAEAAKKSLSLVAAGVRTSGSHPQGWVIHQEPSAGSRLRVRKTVRVILSAGSEIVPVPKLEGRSVEASVGLLREAGLVRGRTTQVHTTQHPAGRVLAQRPLPGEEAPRSSPIGLLVSQGERESRFLMPDLIARRAAPVIARLRALEFKVTDIRYVSYPGWEPGVIVNQLPPPGFRIQRRNLISLEVTK
ncbi:MAG: PASTA domain-containing protein [Candidatus Aminicenantes bacterium]|nr:PASTA domain-containing protein [Candidatus Aminicenantes bacterium]